MDWATAAATVHDQWLANGLLSVPPDNDAIEDDPTYWDQVEALVYGHPLSESLFAEALHPRNRRGQWIRKLTQLAEKLHEGQTDKQGHPYAEHVRAVANAVSRDAKPVALFHDSLEDGKASVHDLGRVLTPTEVQAVQHLTRQHGEVYADYIERIRNAPGRAGDLAREVKRADVQHNLSRIPPTTRHKDTPESFWERMREIHGPDYQPPTEPVENLQSLRQRYERALQRLPLGSRGGDVNRAGLDDHEVEQRLIGYYQRNPTAAFDGQWYRRERERIEQWAKALNVDPQTFAAIVAATSPKNRWEWNERNHPNLRAAGRAVMRARAFPEMSAEQIGTEIGYKGMLGDNLIKAVRVYRGEDPGVVLNAPKTRSFYNNFVWPDDPTSVTVDVMMARAILGETQRADYDKAGDIVLGKGQGYSWAADRIRAAAAELGVLPSEFQAAVWTQVQRELQ